LIRFITNIYDTPTLPPAAGPTEIDPLTGFGGFSPVVPPRRPWKWR